MIDLNNNKHNALTCEDEKEEETEHHTMECEEESSAVMDNEEMYDRNKMMSNDNEKEHKTLNQWCKEVENHKMLKQEVEKRGGKFKTGNENNSFFDEMFNELVVELKEELGTVALKRHDDGHESKDKATFRIDEMCRIVKELCNVEELKDVKDNLKKSV